jgi:hypothetical protein
MSELTGEPQFERMEPREGTARSTCSACQRSIPETYFEAAGRIFCEPCRDAVMATLRGGSGASRLMKALVFGTAAAAVSAVVWYGIVKLTGYELGIIAVAVGFAVGGAVRMGAEHRGGWAYQTLAVVLTYLAIATSYVPMVMDAFRAQSAEEASAPAAAGSGGGEATPSEAPRPVPEAVWVVGAIITSLALPVFQVMNGQFIGLLIVGFALYEAWKINRRQTIAFSGPFRLQRAAGESPA